MRVLTVRISNDGTLNLGDPMRRFRHILYLAGDGERPRGPFLRAVELARTNEARLTVVAVLPRTESEMDMEFGVAAPQVDAVLSRETREELEAFTEAASGAGVGVEAELLRGTPFFAVVQRVLRDGHDLVIKTAEADRSLRARFFGSTDQHLLRKCPCPVWLLDPAHDREIRVVLSAVDVTIPHNPLDAKVVQLGSSLAAREGAEFHLVHGWSIYGESVLRSPRSGLSRSRLNELLKERWTERNERLEALVEQHAGGVDTQVHLEKGDATPVITSVARGVRADVLVMGTVSRSGVPGLLIGNTAESVLGSVRCSVLTVKPEDFETPVQPPT